MKKILITFLTVVCVSQLSAQNISPDNDFAGSNRGYREKGVCKACDTMATGWVIDGNLTGGVVMEDISARNMAGNYLNALNTNIGGLSYKNGMSYGIDLQGGYFFGPGRNFGLGIGVMYMYQQGDLTLDRFHVEYQSLDNYGNTFRQVLTSNGQIKESVTTSNLSIPIVFKCKTGFTKRIGFTGDAGLLVNVVERNNYTSNASFDYEAIYKYSGTEGNTVPVYDNSPVPGSSDLLITKNTNGSTNGNVQQYFNTLRSEGYNVGLNMRPNSTTGTVSYSVPSVGLIIHPALNIWLSSNFSMNVGVTYIYQSFTNNPPANYQLTDKAGTYSPILNDITNSPNHLVAFDLGLRYSFTKPCTSAVGEEQTADTVATPVEPMEDMAVTSPVSEEDIEAEQVKISTPILFDINRTQIKPESYPVLETAVKEMLGSNKSTLVIHGYTDNTGSANYNRTLSKKRATAVKNYLHKKGVKSRMMKTVGHGSKNPAASNSTREGRRLNRRVELKLKPRDGEE